MKKYLLTISAILMLLVTGCEMFPPDDSQTQPITVEKPEISGVSADDTSMTATITPVAGTGFYSYAVIAGPRQTLDPSTLLGLGYSNAVISGIANYAEQQSLTISTDGLSRNVMYYIYAVAASEQGVPSEIEVDSVYTSNSLTPNITGSFSIDTVGVVFAVPFTENVELSGNGNVYVSYYKVNDLADSVNTKKQVVPADSLSVEGNVLYVTVPDKTPGLYITLSWDAGILVNSAGTPNPAWTNDAYGKQNLKMRAGRKAWNLDYQIAVTEDAGKLDTTYYAADSLFTFLPEEASSFIAWFTPAKEVAKSTYAVRVTVNSANGDVLSYDDEILGFSAGGDIAAGISRSLTYGDRLAYTFAAGAFEDVYGNPSTAFTAEGIYLCSYGYTLEDVEGTYSGLLGNGLTGNYEPVSGIEITPIEETSIAALDGFVANVTIENLGLKGSKIYGYLDGDLGTLSVADGQKLGEVELQGMEGKYELQFSNYQYYAPVVFDMPVAGELYSTVQWMLYLPDLNAYTAIYVESLLSRGEATSSAARTTAPAVPTVKLAPRADYNYVLAR